MRDRAETLKTTRGPAFARRRSEGVTLAVAVVFAVGLGVAVGIWINARLTTASSAVAPRPARVLPDAAAAPAAQPSPCDGCETTSADEATPARVPAAKEDEERREAETPAPTGVARAEAPDTRAEPGRPDEVAAVSAEAHGAPAASEAVAAASPDPSRPVAWQVGALPKAGAAAARANVERGMARPVERAADGGTQVRPGPCALYTSANSLSIRAGGAAPLILGGPGVGVRINVSTPDWAALAVIYEGPAAGQNGWLRYSVRSVGRRPGLYTVRVSSPCGSQNISVTVK